MIERPDPEEVEQHLCADKGYDFEDAHETVAEGQYQPHIKHRRRKNEPKEEVQPIPAIAAEAQISSYPDNYPDPLCFKQLELFSLSATEAPVPSDVPKDQIHKIY
ncbi:MAG TPA: hypothetical protein VLA72_21425 [Anaerolineales bacterium]|nr:hypothetical protein [Anaerolineales bacterium]